MMNTINILCILVALIIIIKCHYAHQYPWGQQNCGVFQMYSAAPTRAFAMDQEVAEILLVLGLSSKIVGVSFVSGPVWSSVQSAFDNIPQFGNGDYATYTEIQGTDATILLGFYPSAFTSISAWGGNNIGYDTWMSAACTTVGDDGNLYCRADIDTVLNINTYLQPQNCESASQNPEPVSLDTILDMIWELSSIFDVRESGRDFMDKIESDIASATTIQQKTDLQNLNVLWFDSRYQDTFSNIDDYYVVACCGSQGLILSLAGATNVFKNEGTVTGESFHIFNSIAAVETAFTNANPDVIVITDASYSPALEQLYILCSNPNLKKMTAVQKRRIVMVPFNAGALGARVGISSKNLAEAFVAAMNLLPLNKDSFTQSTTDPSLAVGSSGVTAFLKFPKYTDSNGNTYDLDKICPGSNSIYLGSITPESDDSSDSFSKGAIAGIVIGCFIAIAIIAVVMFTIGRKKGRDEVKLIGTPGLSDENIQIEMTHSRSI